MRALLFSLLIAVVAVLAGAACEKYEAPPTVVIVGLTDATLADPKAPILLDFGGPIAPESFVVTVAKFTPDLEGDLPPDDQLEVYFRHDPNDTDRFGHVDLNADATQASLVPDGAFPVGPKLVLLVEAGLHFTDGRTRTIRTIIPFSYAIACGAGSKASLASGVYFVLLDVTDPIGTQIQLFGAFDVDPSTGSLIAQFTNADRNMATKCPSACPSTDACRLLPAPECVPPSTKAGSVDEYSDFLPNAPPPTGYSIPVEGCATDNGAGTAIITAPATLAVVSPPVTVSGMTMTAFFDASGRATGNLAADSVSLNGNLIGPGKGTMTAILVPPAQVPPGVPPAPARAAAGTTADGGADAAP